MIVHRNGILLLILFALTLIAPPGLADQLAPNPDDIAILRALHADRCTDEKYRLIITDRPLEFSNDPKTHRPIKEFGIELTSRAPPGTLWRPVENCPAVRVADHRELEPLLYDRGALPRDRGAFERKYGVHSYEQVSLPAYSADGKRAVVYLEYLCGLCGHGGFYEFTKTEAGWTITQTNIVWMS